MTTAQPARPALREILGAVVRGFAFLVIFVIVVYLIFAFVGILTDETLAAGDRVVVSLALVLATIVCLLMLALRLDASLLGGAIGRRGLTARVRAGVWLGVAATVLVGLLDGLVVAAAWR